MGFSGVYRVLGIGLFAGSVVACGTEKITQVVNTPPVQVNISTSASENPVSQASASPGGTQVSVVVGPSGQPIASSSPATGGFLDAEALEQKIKDYYATRKYPGVYSMKGVIRMVAAYESPASQSRVVVWTSYIYADLSQGRPRQDITVFTLSRKGQDWQVEGTFDCCNDSVLQFEGKYSSILARYPDSIPRLDSAAADAAIKTYYDKFIYPGVYRISGINDLVMALEREEDLGLVQVWTDYAYEAVSSGRVGTDTQIFTLAHTHSGWQVVKSTNSAITKATFTSQYKNY